MNYKHIYMKIISNAKCEQLLGIRPLKRSRDHNLGYYEFHHILPKSIFPNWKNRTTNIVPLTAREHFFCHQLLTKIYPGRQMIYALYRMATGNNGRHSEKYNISSSTYEKIKEMNSYARKSQVPWNKGKHTNKVPWNKGISYNEILTEDERKKFIPKTIKKGEESHRYGAHMTDESKQKISNAKKGSIPWNKGKKSPQTSGNKNGRAHKCILLNTGEVFETINAAKEKYPMAGHIAECCQGKLKSAGILNGEKLRWAYVD
jgi:hypothetical protein